MKEIKMRETIYILITIIMGLLSGCMTNASTESNRQILGRSDVVLPPPSHTCNTKVNWRGIVPLESSLEDVIMILGEPHIIGIERLGNQEFTYYGYNFHNTHLSLTDNQDNSSLINKIYFRETGLVDRIEVVSTNEQGEFLQVKETVDLVGATLDVVISNSTKLSPADLRDTTTPVVFSPIFGSYSEKLYIWSECGLVLNAIGNPHLQDKSTSWIQRLGDQIFLAPQPNINDKVVVKILFPPTTYEAFINYYYGTIPLNYLNLDKN